MINSEVEKLSLSQKVKVLLRAKYPRKSITGMRENGVGHCSVCGSNSGFKSGGKVIDNKLMKDWDIDPETRKQFDIRESTNCNECNTALRSNLHAKAVLQVFNKESVSIDSALRTKRFKELSIAEINACGELHKHLNKHPGLVYSEYKPSDSTVTREDITDLSYKAKIFDLVLTSDTMEHVPDWRDGFKEIYRILRRGGYHIFTVPAILGRTTRTRATLDEDGFIYHLPKSFHGCTRNVDTDDYIVCSEFGGDFLDEIDAIGFKTSIYYLNLLNINDPNVVFVSKKA